MLSSNPLLARPSTRLPPNGLAAPVLPARRRRPPPPHRPLPVLAAKRDGLDHDTAPGDAKFDRKAAKAAAKVKGVGRGEREGAQRKRERQRANSVSGGVPPNLNLSSHDTTLSPQAAKQREKAVAAALQDMAGNDDDDDDDSDDDPLPTYESVTASARGTGAPQHPQTILLSRDGVPEDGGSSGSGGGGAGSPASRQADALAAREASLWARQEALWDREMARWEGERAAWAAREAALLAALSGMQAEVVRLAGLQLQAGGGAGVDAGTLPAPAPPAAAAPAAQPAAAAAPPPPPAHVPPPPASPSFADHLAAAVATARGGDALADAYGGHGDLLAGGGAQAAPAPPAAAQEAPPAPPPPPPPSPPTPAPLRADPLPAITPPTLVEGSDELFWVNALQKGLADQAFHCGDEEAEDFYFGPGTRSALLTFQACAGLAETGVCDDETWVALLGEVGLAALQPPSPEEEDAADDALSAAVGVGQGPGPASTPAPPPPPTPLPAPGSGPVVETWTATSTTTTITDVEDAAHHHATRVTVEEETSAGTAVVVPPQPTVRGSGPAPPRTAWPIVREGDGGRPVHELHVALNKHGFHCGEDDEQWWQFGDATHAALATFQACAGLPESGVADPRTWLALLGVGATPADGAALSAGDHTDDDMLGGHHDGMIFLVGEQRWARRTTTE